MKYLTTVTLSVFAKPSEEDVSTIKQALVDLVPPTIDPEKRKVKEEIATGFHEQRIHILSLTLTKQAHTTAFLKALLNRLTNEQKELLLLQKESRLDNEFNFFIRIDKHAWLTNRELCITDSGRCFHLKLHLAAYPARRPDALELVEKIFKPERAL